MDTNPGPLRCSFENETVLVFALKEQDVAEYHYRLYRRLATLVAETWSTDVALQLQSRPFAKSSWLACTVRSTTIAGKRNKHCFGGKPM